MKRDWTAAREKVDAEGRCRVCGCSGVKLDAAHIIPRSRVRPGAGEMPNNIVPLCNVPCHAEFDGHRLDLLPYLTFEEQAYAVELVGLAEAYRRITNERLAA